MTIKDEGTIEVSFNHVLSTISLIYQTNVNVILSTPFTIVPPEMNADDSSSSSSSNAPQSSFADVGSFSVIALPPITLMTTYHYFEFISFLFIFNYFNYFYLF